MLFHILKDPKSLTPKPNYQGSMIILTYGHKLITWFGKITIPYVTKIVDIMYPLISKYLLNKLVDLFKFTAKNK